VTPTSPRQGASSISDQLTRCKLTDTELLVRSKPFNHHDSNSLMRLAAPALNPPAVIIADRSAAK
jgi:hypothetical protein